MILFPRGAGQVYADYASNSNCQALALDTSVPLEWAKEALQGKVTLQGNLDPAVLLAGGQALREGATRIVETLGEGPFVFNLGHGILPQTPIRHVEELVGILRP